MLFDEVVFIIETILKVGLEDIKQSIRSEYLYQDKRLCRGGYDLYLAIESIYKAMNLSLEHYFAHDYEVLCEGTRSFPSPREKWVSITNEDFTQVQKSLIAFIKKAQSYHNFLHYEGDLREFFCCKSQWCEFFEKTYVAGKIKDDELRVTYLPWAKPIQAPEWDTRAISKETNSIAYDISTPEKRLKIKELSQANVANMERIMRGMRVFLLKHCTLELMLSK